MRKYFDAAGNPTTAGNAVSSKGLQGGCATFLAVALALFIIGAVIVALAH